MILAIIAVIAFFFLNPGQVLASSIQINEFLAHPSTGNNEWVEFYNPSGENMSSYYLDDDTFFGDDSGNSSKKSLSAINNVNPSYPYLEFSSFLNNSGDWVVLFSSDGTIIDQYQYTSDPGSDVSIGRSPDGGNWTTLASSSKGSSNGEAAITPTPTSTASPSPASSSISTDSSVFTISSIPSQANSDQAFTASVNLSLPDNPNANFYLKGAFKKPDGSNYFGLTKVSGSWIKNGSSYSSQYPLTTDPSGNWSGNLEVHPDAEDSGFTGSDDYIFKVGKYTSSGSGPTWSNEVTIKIIGNPVSDSSGSSPNSSNSSATPKASAKTSITKTSSKTSSIVKLNPKIASIAGVSTASAQSSSSPSASPEGKGNKQINLLPWIGGGFIITGIFSLIFIYLRAKKNP